MRRFISCFATLAAAACLITPAEPIAAQGMQWGTIKGRIVWGGAQLPERKEITITVNPEHCLKDNMTADPKKGTILEENLIVSPKTKGLKNVLVYIYVPDGEKIAIHPSMQKIPGDLVLDQPACMFMPRALVLREGQNLVVKNSAPVQHNIRWIGDGVANQGGNVTIKPGGDATIKDLKAQRIPLTLECNIHGWMKGRLGVVNHPYFAITDDDGNFEIKNVPAGKHNLMIYHEEIGYRLGIKGKNGEPANVAAGMNNLGDLPMGK
jgi:hypothetical protein